MPNGPLKTVGEHAVSVSPAHRRGGRHQGGGGRRSRLSTGASSLIRRPAFAGLCSLWRRSCLQEPISTACHRISTGLSHRRGTRVPAYDPNACHAIFPTRATTARTDAARRRRSRAAARAAALDRGRAERAGRPAAGQPRLGPRRRPAGRQRLLPLRAPADLRGDRRADQRQQAGGRDHGLRAAAEPGQGRGLRRAGLPECAGAERAQRGQHPPLCRDRARARHPAQAGRRQRRDRHQRLQPAGPAGVADPRRGRGPDLQHRRGRLAQRARASRAWTSWWCS